MLQFSMSTQTDCTSCEGDSDGMEHDECDSDNTYQPDEDSVGYTCDDDALRRCELGADA